ncbi:unnamed protein product [Adineta steineri]|uniref:Uncharacterized protein n=1 Tax=Adineta steineri TaxID=433720 RepID=A0A819QS38_9BILA|nr:unnamed protein product [Adineta steineri]CAF1016872.1 unnamed protein product [Adineta steineri]CAF1070775.1 unnamed protein product [Adineta steineri]CAF3865581.1 unnamed protein product [Adineta steineri]CAF3917365.1 unnamed protein product [Adineta steineri]
MTQKDMRQLYLQTFDKKKIRQSEPILKPKNTNWQLWLYKNDNEHEIEDVFQPYFPENMEIFDSNYGDNVITPIQISSDSNKELNNTESLLVLDDKKSSDVEQVQNSHNNENDMEATMTSFEALCRDINKKQRRILHREFERQGGIVNDKVQELFNSFKLQTTVLPNLPSAADESRVESEHLLSTQDETIPSNSLEISVRHNTTAFLYNFQAENFGAEQGAPIVCVACYESGHIKSNCPIESTPNLIEISQEWENVLSKLCQHITERYKPTSNDIENRKQLVRQLQIQYQKVYPGCKLHAYGSFCNGFGLQQSDLDVCIHIKENTHEDSVRILEKLSRSMCCNTFEYVRLVDDVKVPIIRSKHSQLNIELDISIHNKLAIENTNLLKTYAKIDSRVVELGYMIKYLVKKEIWNEKNEPNTMSSGALWIAFLRYYTQDFNYTKRIVTIRQYEPLLRVDKRWYGNIIAIEDPFELYRNLGDHLQLQEWTTVRNVLMRVRDHFCSQPANIIMMDLDMSSIQEHFFSINELNRKSSPESLQTCNNTVNIDEQSEKLMSSAHITVDSDIALQ